jgi:hypothetical protein
MIYPFGACTLDTDRHELRRAGMLCPNRFVGEGILAQRLMTIRKAIGDSGQNQHCIRTVHGRGYRFAAEVSVYTNERLGGAEVRIGVISNRSVNPTELLIAWRRGDRKKITCSLAARMGADLRGDPVRHDRGSERRLL